MITHGHIWVIFYIRFPPSIIFVFVVQRLSFFPIQPLCFVIVTFFKYQQIIDMDALSSCARFLRVSSGNMRVSLVVVNGMGVVDIWGIQVCGFYIGNFATLFYLFLICNQVSNQF